MFYLQTSNEDSYHEEKIGFWVARKI